MVLNYVIQKLRHANPFPPQAGEFACNDFAQAPLEQSLHVSVLFRGTRFPKYLALLRYLIHQTVRVWIVPSASRFFRS